MYSSGGRDVRPAAPPHTGVSFSSLSIDRSPSQETQTLVQEKCERGGRERCAQGKDRSSDKIASQRSVDFGPSNGSSLNVPSKRRATDRHVLSSEKDRYGNANLRDSSFSSLFVACPSPETEKLEKGLLNVTGKAASVSPGHNGNIVTEICNGDWEDLVGGEQYLSPSEGRQAAGPGLENLGRPYNGQVSNESSVLWDHGWSKVEDTSHGHYQRLEDARYRKWLKPEVHKNGSGSFHKSDIGRGWCAVDKELERRLDRYGSGSDREHIFGDAMVGSKNQSSSCSNWRVHERVTSPTMSWSHVYSGSGFKKELGIRRPPDVSGIVNSVHTSFHNTLVAFNGEADDTMHNSYRKKPRLGWGQGLAQYEKEKVEEIEDSSPLKKKSDGVANGEDTTFGALPGQGDRFIIPSSSADSLTTEFPPGQPSSSLGHPATENNSEDSAKSAFERGCLELSQKFDSVKKTVSCRGLQRLVKTSALLDNADQRGTSRSSEAAESSMTAGIVSVGMPLMSNGASQQLSPQDLLVGLTTCIDSSMPSKEVILQRLEKVELDIDLLEKELAKLEGGIPYEEVILNGSDAALNDCQNNQAILFPGALSATDEEQVTNNDEGSFQACSSPLVVETGQLIGLSALPPKVCALDDMAIIVENLIQEDGPPEETTNQADEGIKKLAALNCEEGFTGGENQASGDILGNVLPEISQILEPAISLTFFDNKECKKGVSPLISANEEIAKHSFDPLEHLILKNPVDDKVNLYSGSEGAVVWSCNTGRQEKKMKYLEEKITEEKRLLKFKERVLTLKYRALRECWRKDGPMHLSQGSSLQLHPITSGLVRSDDLLEESHAVKKFLSELGDQRAYLRMPAMILNEKERNSCKFVTNNGLVEDPVALEQERKAINPWSAMEKKVFLDMLYAFGKNFSKIASFLEHKTVADCVEFYYRNQKSEEFQKVLRKQKLKKRRDNSRASASYLATTTSINNQHREVTAARVEGLSLVAAAAAAVAAADLTKDISKAVRSAGRAAECGLSSHLRSLGTLSEMRTLYGKEKSVGNSPGNNVITASGSTSNSSIVGSANTKVFSGKFSSKKGSVLGDSVTKINHLEHPASLKGARSIYSHSMHTSQEADLQWTDNERNLFTAALSMFGKDFCSISMHVGSKSQGQCKAFFSKIRKRLGLDQLLERFHATLQAGPVTGVNGTKQVGSPESPKSAGILEDRKGYELYSSPTIAKISNTERTEFQYGSNAGYSLTEIPTQTTTLGNLSEAEIGIGMFLERNDKASSVVKSSITSAPIVTDQSSLMQQVVPESADVNTSCLIAAHGKAKEEVESLTIEVDKVFTESGELTATLKDTHGEVVTASVRSRCMASFEASEVSTEEGKVKIDSVADVGRNGVQEHAIPSSKASEVPDAAVSAASWVTTSTSVTIIPVTQNPQIKERTAPRMGSGGELKLRREATSWTQEEKEKFIEIIRKHGKDWALLHENLPSKSLTQIKTYFQNSKAKLGFATEGSGNANTRIGGRKRRTDDSESSSNAGSAGQICQQQSTLYPDNGGLKANGGVLSTRSMSGSIGGNMAGVEALAYALLSRNPGQIFEEPSKVFHQIGLTAQNLSTTGVVPRFQPAALSVFTSPTLQCPNNLNVQQSLGHSTTSKSQQVVSPQQSLSPVVIVQQSQQQVSPAGIHQQSHILHQQQQQAVGQSHQDLQNHVVQHLQRQAVQQHQVLLQQQQQVVQHLPQQHQPQKIQLQQEHEQPQLVAHASHHQHVIHNHRTNSHLASQNIIQNQQVTSQHVSVNHVQQSSSQQKGLPQQQQHSDQFPSQIFQLHPTQQGLLQQLPHHHQLLQHHQLQLHLQEQQLKIQRQQQQVHTQEKTQMLQFHKQISGIQQQQGGFHHPHGHLHQRQQLLTPQLQTGQQLALLIGAAQTVNASSEMMKWPGPEKQATAKSQQLVCEDLQQPHVISQLPKQTWSKALPSSDTEVCAADVKLFGWSLRSQPSANPQQLSSQSSGNPSLSQFGLASPSATSACTLSSSDVLSVTCGPETSFLGSAFGRAGVSFLPGQGWQGTWPNTSVGSANPCSTVGSLQISNIPRSMDSETESHSVQKAAARIAAGLIREGRGSDGWPGELVNTHPKLGSSICEQSVSNRGVQDCRTPSKGSHNASHCGIMDQKNISAVLVGEQNHLDPDKGIDVGGIGGSDLETPISKNRVPDYSALYVGTPAGQGTSYQPVPSPVMDALMAITEWRLQHAGSSCAQETEASFDQHLEALMRCPGSALEPGGKGSPLGLTTLGPTFVGGSGAEILQHSRDGLHYAQPHPLPIQGHADSRVAWASSDLVRLNDTGCILVPAVPIFQEHGSSCSSPGADELGKENDQHDSEKTCGVAE